MNRQRLASLIFLGIGCLVGLRPSGALGGEEPATRATFSTFLTASSQQRANWVRSAASERGETIRALLQIAQDETGASGDRLVAFKLMADIRDRELLMFCLPRISLEIKGGGRVHSGAEEFDRPARAVLLNGGEDVLGVLIAYLERTDPEVADLKEIAIVLARNLGAERARGLAATLQGHGSPASRKSWSTLVSELASK
jgi:hypothetical protein